MMAFNTKKLLPWILAGIFFVVGVATLPDYGMHEDSPFHFLRGQYYLNRVLGGDGTFDIPPLRSPVLFGPRQRISSYKLNASEELFAPLLPIEDETPATVNPPPPPPTVTMDVENDEALPLFPCAAPELAAPPLPTVMV